MKFYENDIIDYDFMVELNYLNDVKNDFNEGKNIK